MLELWPVLRQRSSGGLNRLISYTVGQLILLQRQNQTLMLIERIC